MGTYSIDAAYSYTCAAGTFTNINDARDALVLKWLKDMQAAGVIFVNDCKEIVDEVCDCTDINKHALRAFQDILRTLDLGPEDKEDAEELRFLIEQWFYEADLSYFLDVVVDDSVANNYFYLDSDNKWHDFVVEFDDMMATHKRLSNLKKS